MTEGGDGTFGRPCSEETKQKISIANSGKTASEYTRKLLSEAGKVRTEGRDKYWKSGKIGETRKKTSITIYFRWRLYNRIQWCKRSQQKNWNKYFINNIILKKEKSINI